MCTRVRIVCIHVRKVCMCVRMMLKFYVSVSV